MSHSIVMENPLFEKVEDALYESERLIAWDGCHKIYVAMDATEAAWFRENYPEVVENDDVDVLLGTLAEWWDASCSLRFINAVQHCESNPNAGFTTLIGQFEQEESEREECEDEQPDDGPEHRVAQEPRTDAAGRVRGRGHGASVSVPTGGSADHGKSIHESTLRHA